MRMTRIVLAVCFSLWVSLGVAEDGEALPFPVSQAEYRPVLLEQIFDGVVEAVNQATISAQTSGRIVELNFDVDDYVAKDSVILRFRDTEQRARLDQAEASLREAQARYREADDEYTRIKDVFERKLVAKSAMDKASADFKAATARLEAAKAAAEAAKEQLAHTIVRAPYSGIVVERHVELGETAQVGQPLMTGLSLEQLRVVVDVPQQFIGSVRSDGRAYVIFPTRNGTRVDAASLTVFPYADAATHTFKVRVHLPEGQHGVYPGMMVKVAFVTGQAEHMLIPASAVVTRSEVTGVYLVDEKNRVSLRQIRIGRRHADGSVEILAGLEAGDRVALDPIRAGVYLKEQRAGERS